MLGRSHIIWLPLLTSFSTINAHFAWSKFQVIENDCERSGCRWGDKFSPCLTSTSLHANTLHLYGIEVVWTIISSGFLYLNRGLIGLCWGLDWRFDFRFGISDFSKIWNFPFYCIWYQFLSTSRKSHKIRNYILGRIRMNGWSGIERSVVLF